MTGVIGAVSAAGFHLQRNGYYVIVRDAYANVTNVTCKGVVQLNTKEAKFEYKLKPA